MSRINQVIEDLRRKSIQEPHSVPAPTPEQITNAETKLGIKFPPSFLIFLEKAGTYQLPYWETYWVGNASLGFRNIIAANMSEREETESSLPLFLVAFQNNGCGDQICFDVRNRNEHGEYPIVLWDHELGPEENLRELEILADSFAEWLEAEVKNAS